MNFKKLVLTSTLLVSTLFAGTYNIDGSHSNMGFKVKHMMISNTSGNFSDFSGKFEYDEKTKKLISLSGEIKTASINTEDKKRDDHLRANDILDVNKYPKILFKLTSIKDDIAYGDLTMKGVTKNIKLDFENGGAIKDPWGTKRAGFSLYGKINRKDFGITWNKILETGGIAVGEIVKLNIEIEGIKTK